MKRVEFWFDPICPFCWVTSRWLVQVAPHRDLDVVWQPISLLFKNDPPEGSEYYIPTAKSRDMLRVVEAVRAADGEDRIGDLYTALGIQIHNHKELDFDLAEVLTGLGVDSAHANAKSDEKWDSVIREKMDEGLALTGDDVGTPIIAIEGKAGKVGLFGPVISELPNLDDSLDLWDGFLKMVDTAGFFELKRTRAGDPNIPSVEAIS